MRSVRILLGLLLVALSVAPLSAATYRRTLAAAGDSDALVAALTDDSEIYLEAKPLAGEGLLAFARRLSGSEGAAEAIVGVNDGAERLLAGVRYRVPYVVLRDDLKLQVARTLFGDDVHEREGWRHRVRGAGPLARGSLWRVAEWFTGRGENFQAIRAHNRLVEDELRAGQELVIPESLLLPPFRRAPVEVGKAGEPVRVATAGDASERGTLEIPYRLEYGRDAKGEYAVYRLAPGEALYSSVVVRFIGAVLAPDVNALAAEVAQRSGIADVTDIPVGHPVKIPFELLLPEYLPPGHPRRLEYEASLRESGRFTNRVRTADLSGVTVILDAGHGGEDPGASFAGVWESLYVYDVKLRIKQLLETHTAAHVVVTTRDGDDFSIPDRDVLPFSRHHEVLTHPPYPIKDSTVGVHLRWYLANSVFAQATANHVDPQKVVFLSLHADSLHPSLRGAMAYIPAASMRRGSFRKVGAVYETRREWREHPSVSFSWQERIESEGLSRELADDMIEALRARDVAIHPYKPVREKIVRNRSEFVPAVLRYNAVPAKVLLEICNLANDQDRKLLQTRVFRERIAEAVVEGILRYYGQGDGFEESLRIAAAGGAR